MRLLAITAILLVGIATTPITLVPSNSAPASVQVTAVPATQPTVVVVGRAVLVGAVTQSMHSTATVATLGTHELRTVLRRAGWPEGLLATAMEVAGCESGWRTGAIGANGELGLFQIHPVHTEALADGANEAELMDPIINAETALELWRESGWGPWSCAPGA